MTSTNAYIVIFSKVWQRSLKNKLENQNYKPSKKKGHFKNPMTKFFSNIY